MENSEQQPFVSPSDKPERVEIMIESKTGKPWSEWEHILEMTDIATANQQEFIADLRQSFNIENLIAAVIVTHYKSKKKIPFRRLNQSPEAQTPPSHFSEFNQTPQSEENETDSEQNEAIQ